MEGRNQFDLLSNDLLSHVLRYAERTTEVHRVCRRFCAVYQQYGLWAESERILIADHVVNLTGGTVRWLGFTVQRAVFSSSIVCPHAQTTPALRAFAGQAPSSTLLSKDTLAAYGHLMVTRGNDAAWVSAKQILHVACFASAVRVVATPLRPYLAHVPPVPEWRVLLGDSVVVLWCVGAPLVLAMDRRTLQPLAHTVHSEPVWDVELVGARECAAVTTDTQLCIYDSRYRGSLGQPLPLTACRTLEVLWDASRAVELKGRAVAFHVVRVRICPLVTHTYASVPARKVHCWIASLLQPTDRCCGWTTPSSLTMWFASTL